MYKTEGEDKEEKKKHFCLKVNISENYINSENNAW